MVALSLNDSKPFSWRELYFVLPIISMNFSFSKYNCDCASAINNISHLPTLTTSFDRSLLSIFSFRTFIRAGSIILSRSSFTTTYLSTLCSTF
uniref:Uncharacterized protein n=1 Tax=Anopheles quadriannulatus TaxID=34691 RepID=A0A182XS58_ANOQN